MKLTYLFDAIDSLNDRVEGGVRSDGEFGGGHVVADGRRHEHLGQSQRGELVLLAMEQQSALERLPTTDEDERRNFVLDEDLLDRLQIGRSAGHAAGGAEERAAEARPAVHRHPIEFHDVALRQPIEPATNSKHSETYNVRLVGNFSKTKGFFA